MTILRRPAPWRAALALAALAACAAAPAPEQDFTARALAARMARRPVVLLGEVHDNAIQHAVRAQALELLLQSGARPALAFEQFDRERQPDIDRILAREPADDAAAAGQLAALGPHGWNWSYYRPFLLLALRYRLPIVAVNLSRADAMRVAREGFGAVFDAGQQRRLGLDPLPPELLRAQQQAVDEGHCHRMDAQMLPALARAQIARDAAIAEAIRPYLQRGMVMLTGNGHARRDIGVPYFLAPAERERVVSIALIERDHPDAAGPSQAYDAVFLTPVQSRPDPCLTLPAPASGG